MLQSDLRGKGVYAEGAAAADPASILQRRCSSAATGRVFSCRAGHVDLASCRSSMGYAWPSPYSLCGSQLFSVDDREAELKLGILSAAATPLAPSYELWIKRREPWLRSIEGAEQYEEDRP